MLLTQLLKNLKKCTILILYALYFQRHPKIMEETKIVSHIVIDNVKKNHQSPQDS